METYKNGKANNVVLSYTQMNLTLSQNILWNVHKILKFNPWVWHTWKPCRNFHNSKNQCCRSNAQPTQCISPFSFSPYNYTFWNRVKFTQPSPKFLDSPKFKLFDLLNQHFKPTYSFLTHHPNPNKTKMPKFEPHLHQETGVHCSNVFMFFEVKKQLMWTFMGAVMTKNKLSTFSLVLLNCQTWRFCSRFWVPNLGCNCRCNENGTTENTCILTSHTGQGGGVTKATLKSWEYIKFGFCSVTFSFSGDLRWVARFGLKRAKSVQAKSKHLQAASSKCMCTTVWWSRWGSLQDLLGSFGSF